MAILYFLQTRDATLLVLGMVAAFVLGVAGWSYLDAERLEMPAGPWLLVVVFAPVIGLAAYLIAREVRLQRGAT